MTPGLQAGFGGPLGAELLAELYGLGYRAARIEQGATPSETQLLTEEVLAAKMTPIVIIFQAPHVRTVPVGAVVEIENEPDLPYPDRAIAPRPAMSPQAYLDLVDAVVSRADPGLMIYAGAVSNPNRRGLAFLEAIVPKLPHQLGLSCHRYPHGGANERGVTPHAPFASREDEVAALMRLAGHRLVAITEGGYHTAPRRGKTWGVWPVCRRWTPEEVAALWASEWNFWRRMNRLYTGQIGYVIRYQLNDGPDPDNALHTYGIRDYAGAWKPSAPVTNELFMS